MDWNADRLFKNISGADKVIAYTANEFQMEVDLWEIAAAGSKLNIRMIYTDRRSFSGSGGVLDPSSR